MNLYLPYQKKKEFFEEQREIDRQYTTTAKMPGYKKGNKEDAESSRKSEEA